MKRSWAAELLDDPALPDPVHEAAHRSLTRFPRWLGNTRAIQQALRRGAEPARRILDLGCGRGGLLADLHRQTTADLLGVDLRASPRAPVPIIQADAVRGLLPDSDVAICVCLAHHLSESDLIAMIRNVGRSSRRLVLLDPVRHWLPLALFRIFVYPFLHPVTAADGVRSIRRSYTPKELRALVACALHDTGAHVRFRVAPFYVRQMVDISYYP